MTRLRGDTDYHAWYIVGFLSLLYGLSFVDRFALSLLAEPVIQSFGLSASQMGLLLGAGFALLYSLTGLPLAHILDRNRRKYVLAGGIAIWSASTVLSAFAQDYSHLLICRSGVAIGEGVLTPAAISLIGDFFEEDRRRMPICVYSSISSFMATGSFLVGAAALQLATSWSGTLGLEPWRITLIILGLPGVILAGIFALTAREPARRTDGLAASGEASAGIGEVWAYLVSKWRFYVPFYLALGSMSTLVYALISWAPTLLSREHGLATTTAGYMFGLIGGAAGFIGTFLWPAVASRIDPAGRGRGLSLIFIACVIVGTLGILAAMKSVGLVGLSVGLAFAMLTLPPINSALSSLLIQGFGPASMRARLIALNILVVNLFGYTVGPQFIGAFIDASPSNSISAGVLWLACFTAPLSTILFIVARRSLLAATESSAVGVLSPGESF